MITSRFHFFRLPAFRGRRFVAAVVLSLFLATEGKAQPAEIRGTVRAIDEKGVEVPLPGATVYYDDGREGVSADAEGRFSIRRRAARHLIAQYVGHRPDTIAVESITGDVAGFILKPDATLEQVTVTSARRGTGFSSVSLQKTELISQTGLMKMACCNLAESFENSATVTVGFTDAISGARQVQLLGLPGMYSQTMAENIPVMRGLASTYGWSHTPGTWLESIQISKGASSVVNGYESISGQMNLEFKKPNDTEDLFINLYGDHAGRMEANVTAAAQVADKLWTGLLVHGSMEDREHDGNRDGFMDMPRTQLINLYNRWFYLDPARGVESRTGIKFLTETRRGGQMSSIPAAERYETRIDNRNAAVENKTGFSVGRKPGQSLGIITSFSHYEQDSRFGMRSFEGTQNSLYANVLFGSHLGTTAHRYTVGGSFAYDDYRTSFEDRLPFNQTPLTRLDREEIVPGVFGQYTYSPVERFTLLVGARGDHNSAYGWLFTPRMNVRYELTESVVLRASAGRGFRSPQVIAENIGLLASSRRLHVETIPALDIEKAWNFGGNVSLRIPIWNRRTMTLSLDWFRTIFENQAVVDMERDSRAVWFYNLDGRSFADAWQADLTFTAFKGFDVLAAFRYNNTRVTLTDGLRKVTVEKPLVSRYRGLVNLSYATNFRKWIFDATAQINGPSRLPNLGGYDGPSEESPVFPVWFAQVTKRFKRLDVYAGVENIFDYTQDNPILGADDPFGERFDSSRVWGPLMGRKIYAGIRLRIGNF